MLSEFEKNLLLAYLDDNHLSIAQQNEARQLLANNAAARQFWETHVALQTKLSQATYDLPQLRQVVLQKINQAKTDWQDGIVQMFPRFVLAAASLIGILMVLNIYHSENKKFTFDNLTGVNVYQSYQSNWLNDDFSNI
ncbi:MAG: hypothetical protein R2798_07410 [Chitinophagales bacterium]|nr:hypothetical protein [Bacteroidota bacterium]